MTIHLTDKEIDKRIKQAADGLKLQYGINVSKGDIIRKLINIKTQGKKTTSIWRKIKPKELKKWF